MGIKSLLSLESLLSLLLTEVSIIDHLKHKQFENLSSYVIDITFFIWIKEKLIKSCYNIL